MNVSMILAAAGCLISACSMVIMVSPNHPQSLLMAVPAVIGKLPVGGDSIHGHIQQGS